MFNRIYLGGVWSQSIS